MYPPMEDEVEEENDEPLKWKRHGLRGPKGKEKFEETTKVVKIYTTRIVEKKLLGDAMKANKTETTKRRGIKKISG